MAEAARFDRLRECFEVHLIETEGQIERLNECLSAKPPAPSPARA
jgi:Mn-containing catalase